MRASGDQRETPGGRIVGIDLGTTNSIVAIWTPSGPSVLGGARAIMPSAVRYEAGDDDGVRVVVGEDARERATEFPRSTITSVKRLMGRSASDALGPDASGMAPSLAYRVEPGPRETVRIVASLAGDGSKEGERVIRVSPEEVSASILRELKTRAEAELGGPVSRAVITVPAYFDDAQRQATRDAARLAGLEVSRLVNEPTAAALAYGAGNIAGGSERTIAVYDLGGGTFDVSILRIIPPDPDAPELGEGLFRVLSTAGDTGLGGDDIDGALMGLFAGEMGVALQEGAIGGGLSPEASRALRSFAQGVKHRLSEAESTEVEIATGAGEPYRRTITRGQFEDLIAPLAQRTRVPCERALRDAGIGAGGLDAAVLVGGSTRIPMIRAIAREVFGVEPYTSIDPDLAIAMGAAQQAGMIERGERGEIGALLLDVVPLSLGIETVGGAMAKLIMRNSGVPARAREMFSTSVDGQTSIRVHVLQGEREMAEDCRSLGVFDLKVPPMPAGAPQLEVEFMVDVNGVLRVRATEKRSGREAKLEVVPSHGLTRDEVDRIEAESVTHARDDMTRHRIADLIANASLDLRWIRAGLEKHGSELDEAARADLTRMTTELATMIKRAGADWRSVDPGEMHNLKEAMDRASVRLQEIAITRSLQSGDEGSANAG